MSASRRAWLAVLSLGGASLLAPGWARADEGAPRAGSPAPAALVLGEFPLAGRAVVDGDTLRLASPSTSVRVQSVDAEEIFHAKRDREEAERDFAAYAQAKRAEYAAPVKYGTPAGEEARRFAEAFFEGIKTVRLEADEPGLDHDGYGRLLAHVFVRKGDQDVLYAEELIRAGLSHYFVKYGRSQRFDARFKAAQAEAVAAKRGIWGEATHHYPDYPERLAWWERRAKQVDAWLQETKGHPEAADHVRLTIPTETARLEGLVGRRVVLFGSVDHLEAHGETWRPGQPEPPEPEVGAGPPYRLLLVDKPHQPFPVVVFDVGVWKALDHGQASRSFVRVTGILQRYRDRLQVVLASPTDLSTR